MVCDHVEYIVNIKTIQDYHGYVVLHHCYNYVDHI